MAATATAPANTNGASQRTAPTRTLRGRAPKEARPGKPKIVIFGKPGVGKTWQALDFPNVYYIDTEGGADLGHYQSKLEKSGGLYFGPDDGARDFDKVLEEIITLATIKHDYKTLVIDSYTKLFNTRMAESEEALRAKGNKIEFSVEKKEPIKMTRRLIAWFDKLDMNVILICHEKPLWGLVNGQREEIGATLDGWDKLEYELHLSLRIVKEGPSRIAKISKTRLQGFPDANNFEWSYAEFAKRYGRDIIEDSVHVTQLASEKQVEDLLQLIEVLNVDPDKTASWMEKSSVESWNELPMEHMQKLIDQLRAKIPQL